MFDGSDPEKLQQFLVLLKLNFKACPHTFTTDAQHINFALSYLQGSTLEWFEPDILSQNPTATWMANFEEFESDLHMNFSTFNPVGDAEDQLDNIVMKDNQCIKTLHSPTIPGGFLVHSLPIPKLLNDSLSIPACSQESCLVLVHSGSIPTPFLVHSHT